MRPKKSLFECALEWLEYARADIAVAEQCMRSDIKLGAVCFHLQQAAEKSLKAVPVNAGIHFPYTHDLDKLCKLIESASIQFPKDLNKVKRLSAYAVWTRYPGGDEVELEEYQESLHTARQTVKWEEGIIAAHDPH